MRERKNEKERHNEKQKKNAIEKREGKGKGDEMERKKEINDMNKKIFSMFSQDAEEEQLFRVITELRRERARLLASDAPDGQAGRADQRGAELLRTEQKILDFLQARRAQEPQ